MKTPKHFLIAAAAAATLIAAVQAGEPLLSPRAAQLRYELRKVPGTTPDMIDRAIQPGSPRSRDLGYSLRKVPSTGPSIDLAHAPRPTMSPKDPRFEAVWRENAIRQFKVAPVK
jgi:hypothetical protein